MTAAWRSVLRGAVITAGAAVVLASCLTVRLNDWPTYLVFLAVSALLFLPSVEVLPRLTLGIPQMATTIGFLYIGGPPIIVLAFAAPLFTRLLRRALPGGWSERVPQLEGLLARRDLLAGGAESMTQLLAEQSTFVLGLWVRWWLVSLLAPGVEPTRAQWAMAVAEIAGHHCWGVLAILPIYPDRTLLPLSFPGGLRTALADIGLIVAFSVTPFVFLIAYGYQTGGLTDAAAWSLTTLGLHFMLKRLTERRLKVEEQNRRLETLNRELEHRERLSAIGKMSSVVSHQILQQLGVIGMHADLIRNATSSGDPVGALAQTRQHAGTIETA
jgi:signal transduction histidine kinase